MENENLEIIEKEGKIKGLSNEEIEEEKNKVQLLEDMNAAGIIMKEQIKEEKKQIQKNFTQLKK